MLDRTRLHLCYARMASVILRTCCTVLLLTLALPINGVAKEILRSDANAFGFPYDRTADSHANFIAVPALIHIDGRDYLKYIEESIKGFGGGLTPATRTCTIYTVGPLQALLDSTLPWEDLIYSSEVFDPVEKQRYLDGCDYYYNASLVDLDNDGVLEIFDVETNDLSTLASSPQLINDNLVKELANHGFSPWSAGFLDMDGDGDLDLIVNYEEPGPIYFENTGTPEMPRFDNAGVNAVPIWESHKAFLPPGFAEYHAGDTPNLVSADMDQDGDLDIIRTSHPSQIEYYENMGPTQDPVFSNPYSPWVPISSRFEITDYDTDGDLDLLSFSWRNGKARLFEKLNGRQIQYKPADIALSPLSLEHFGGFSDLDGDGVQEVLAIVEDRLPEDHTLEDLSSRKERLVLLKREDDAFKQIPIYVFPRGSVCPCPIVRDSLQFVDGDNDGDMDIAMRLSGPEVDRYYFEQQAPLSFGPPQILPITALDLKPPTKPGAPKFADLDGDGDIDKMWYSLVEWNHEREPGSIVNFSTRSHVFESASILIGGFIIEGPSPQTVIIRGQGPSLAAMGVADPLSDPEIHLFSGQTPIASNDDWQTAAGADKIVSAGQAPTDPREAALRVRLNPGPYTVHLAGKAGDTGVGIIGIFADNQMPTTSSQINISSRALVQEGENLTIGGFIIDGDTPVRVLIRGLGPSMQENGVTTPLADPTITLFSGSSAIASNDDWKQSDNASEIAALNSAPSHEKEAAILKVLQPGAYTVHLRDAQGGSGIGMVAIDRP